MKAHYLKLVSYRIPRDQFCWLGSVWTVGDVRALSTRGMAVQHISVFRYGLIHDYQRLIITLDVIFAVGSWANNVQRTVTTAYELWRHAVPLPERRAVYQRCAAYDNVWPRSLLRYRGLAGAAALKNVSLSAPTYGYGRHYILYR
jgi:hypothetical protein